LSPPEEMAHLEVIAAMVTSNALVKHWWMCRSIWIARRFIRI